eukprot:Gb_39718 [translate_table: standard]
MALTPFLGRSRNSSLWDSWDRSLFDPWIPISRMWDTLDTPAFSFSKDAHAVANTRVDWKETPESHIFTADMPGTARECEYRRHFCQIGERSVECECSQDQTRFCIQRQRRCEKH